MEEELASPEPAACSACWRGPVLLAAFTPITWRSRRTRRASLKLLFGDDMALDAGGESIPGVRAPGASGVRREVATRPAAR